MFHHSHDPKEIVFFPYVYPYINLATMTKGHDHGLPRQDIQYLNWGLSGGRLLAKVRDAVRGWFERSRARRALYEMDDRMLADIGITRGDIENVLSGRYDGPNAAKPSADVHAIADAKPAAVLLDAEHKHAA